MSQAARYVDRPARRIGISVTIAVAAHLLIGGAAWVLFKDRISPGLTVAPGYHRIGREEIEQVLAETPSIIGEGGLTFSGGSDVQANDDLTQVAEGFSSVTAIRASDAELPFSSMEWAFDPTFLTSPIGQPPARRPAR